MIVALRDPSGQEYRLGVAEGRFVEPDAVSGPMRDLRHLVALTGLADCHAHLSGDGVTEMVEYDGSGLSEKMLRNARRQMAGGVLLLAEKGSKTSLTLRVLTVDEWERPRMQMAGRMIAIPGGYYEGFAAEITGENLDSVIAEAVEGGARWVKLVGDWPRKGEGAVPNFSQDELDRIVAISHAAGCRVAIHAAAPATPGRAVRAGVDSIEHGLFLERDDVVALGERGGAWVPTVVAMESIAAWLGESSTGGRVLTAGLENTASLLGFALDAGVAVLTGTDLAVGHGEVAKEAVKLTEYGLSAAQAVSAASQAAYDYLGFDNGFAVGREADAVLFTGDPSDDISLLLDPQVVMRAGRIIVERA